MVTTLYHCTGRVTHVATISSRRIPTSQFLLGAIIVLLGILLLFNTTGVYPTQNLLLYVPALFVILGIWILVQSRFQSLLGPVLLIVVAGAAQLVVLEYATVDQVVVYWPVIVIAFGLSLALSQYRSRVHHSDASFSTGMAIFGGVEKRNTSKAFTGGELMAIFGGTELDLRDTEVADRPARINVTVLFGEVEITVPRDWNVQMDVLPVLGAAADDRPRDNHHDEVDLIVTGFVAFGDASVTG